MAICRLPGGADEYSNFGLAIPMGFGVRKAVNKTISIGINLQYTKTFTDYIDDVSGNYFDNEALLAEHGPEGAYLADPNLGLIPGQSAPGQQRGDPDDLDAYLFLKFHVHYRSRSTAAVARSIAPVSADRRSYSKRTGQQFEKALGSRAFSFYSSVLDRLAYVCLVFTIHISGCS